MEQKKTGTQPTMSFKFKVTTHLSNHQLSLLCLDLFVLFSAVRLHFLNKPIIIIIITCYKCMDVNASKVCQMCDMGEDEIIEHVIL